MDIEEQYDKIYRFCFYRVGNRQLAEDLTQETFLRFLDSRYKESGKQMGYLYTIAGNLCSDEVKRLRWTEVPLDENMPDGGRFCENLIDRVFLETIMQRLTEDERDLLVLRYVNEEPDSLICRQMNISRFALYRKIASIRRRVDQWMGGEMYGRKRTGKRPGEIL